MPTYLYHLTRLLDRLKWPVVVAFGLWLLSKPASDWAFAVLTSDRIRIAEMLKVVIWPLLVAVGLLAFRRPLSTFLEGIGQRVTKFSVFKVEFELTAAQQQLRPLAITVVDELKQVRADDSGAGLLRMVAEDGTPADYATIDLGGGHEWLTSRLFILAVMLQRMRATRCVVFVATEQGEAGRFVGVVPLQTLRWSLARAYPWLEATYAYVYAAELAWVYPSCAVSAQEPAPNSPWYQVGTVAPGGSEPMIRSSTGALAADLADRIVRRYIRVLGNAGAAVEDGTWTPLSNNRRERASWINAEAIVTLFGAGLQDSTVSVSRLGAQPAVVDDLMRQRDDFVAILGHRGRFKGLIDRQALLKQAAGKAL